MTALRFDENEITVGDLEDFEDITGRPLEEVLAEFRDRKPEDTSLPPLKVLKAIIFLAKRHEDPAFTAAMARDVKISELEIVPIGVDPTVAAG